MTSDLKSSIGLLVFYVMEKCLPHGIFCKNTWYDYQTNTWHGWQLSFITVSSVTSGFMQISNYNCFYSINKHSATIWIITFFHPKLLLWLHLIPWTIEMHNWLPKIITLIQFFPILFVLVLSVIEFIIKISIYPSLQNKWLRRKLVFLCLIS